MLNGQPIERKTDETKREGKRAAAETCVMPAWNAVEGTGRKRMTANRISARRHILGSYFFSNSGAPVPSDPTKTLRPSGNCASRPLNLLVPSFARKPVTVTSMPSGTVFFVQPRRYNPFG